jgi:7,8-dihydropterin-6-yl-methyl-4-(beta-D-ribofuranosyl)aminobenzene 5'-phosphate synthase
MVELDELRLLIVVDNETDTLSSIDAGVPQIPEVASLIPRVPSIHDFNGHECKPVFEHLCCACHGFSVLVMGRRGQEEHVVLFDVGPYPDIWLANATRLAIDMATAPAFPGLPRQSQQRAARRVSRSPCWWTCIPIALIAVAFCYLREP